MKKLIFVLFLISNASFANFKVSKPKDVMRERINLIDDSSCRFEITDSYLNPSNSPLEQIEISSRDFNSTGEFVARDSYGNIIRLILKNEGDKLNIRINAGEERGRHSYSNVTVVSLDGLKVSQPGWLTGFLKMGGVTGINFVCK